MKKCLLAISCMLAFFIPVHGQNISGIINSYTIVNGIYSSSVSVVSSTGFAVGGKVIIIEMQGASINQSNTPSFGNITSYANAGNYEFDTISSVGGNLITFTHALCRTYDIAGNVQLVTVPIYSNPTITGKLTCQAWNGATGGILIFQATGTVTMNANIDVSMLGFRGGNFVNSYFGCGNYNYYLPYANYYIYSGGEKGESISEYITNENGGMGKQANGGGGGQPGNSGGGGGGNYGAGGMGGNEYSGCGTSGVQGYGGVALSNAGNRMFMGGGGGGGLADNGRAVTAGGNGGAIVYITANTLAGNSNTIMDTGQSVTGIASDESSGGGGAGGSVLLNVTNYNTPITVNTNGGYGGSGYNVFFPTACHGTGGGGGAGLIWTSGNTVSPNITAVSNGGIPGVMLNPASSCYLTSNGATSGTTTTLRTNLPQFKGLPTVFIGRDTTVCFGNSILLNASDTFATYLWQNGSTNDTLTADTSGNFFVTVVDSSGCSASDTVKIKVQKPINFNLGSDTSSSSSSSGFSLTSDTTICPGKQLLLKASGGFTSYLWQDNSTDSTLTTSAAGKYYVTVIDSFGCKGSDTVVVKIEKPIKFNIGDDTSLCIGKTVLFKAPAGFITYMWQDGSTDSSDTAKAAGTYYVQVTDTLGCKGGDTSIVKIYAKDSIDLGKPVICSGNPAILNAGAGYTSYLWQDNSGSQTDSAKVVGKYFVTVVDAEGCISSDTAQVTAGVAPVIYLGKDTALCIPFNKLLNPGVGFASYLWLDSATTITSSAPTYTATVPGKYSVTVVDTNGCTAKDSIEIANKCPEVQLPGAFVPGDGVNGIFRAYGENVIGFDMRIFNRWGQLIFETNDIDNGWDGRFNGVPEPIGVYVYEIQYVGTDNIPHLAKGNVTLLR